MTNLSIVERFCKRRLRSISATTGCDFFVLEKPELQAAKSSQSGKKSILFLEEHESSKNADIKKLRSEFIVVKVFEYEGQSQLETHVSNHCKLSQTPAIVYLNEPEHFHGKVLQKLFLYLEDYQCSLKFLQTTGWRPIEATWQNSSSKQTAITVVEKFLKNYDFEKHATQNVKTVINHATSPKVKQHYDINDLVIRADGNCISCFVKLKSIKGSDEKLPEVLKCLSTMKNFATIINRCDDHSIEILAIVSQQNAATYEGTKLFAVLSPSYPAITASSDAPRKAG